MEGCQSSCTGTDAVDTVIELIDRTAQAVDSLVAESQLAAIDSFGRTGGYRTVSHAAYDVVAHVDIAVFDSDVTIAVNGLNGKTIIIYCRIAGRYTIKIR